MKKYIKAAVYGAAATVGSIVFGTAILFSTGSAIAGLLVTSGFWVGSGALAQSSGASLKQIIVGAVAGIAASFGLAKVVESTLPDQGPFEHRTRHVNALPKQKGTMHFNDASRILSVKSGQTNQPKLTQALRV